MAIGPRPLAAVVISCVTAFAAIAAEARNGSLEDIGAIAQICRLEPSGTCVPVASVPAERTEEDTSFVAKWRPPSDADRSSRFRAKLSALRAPLATAAFQLPPLEGDEVDSQEEIDIPFAVSIASFWILPAGGGSARITPSGTALALADGAASLVVPAGAAPRYTVRLTPNAGAPSPAGLLSSAFSFGPETLDFKVPATVTVAYDPARIPAGSSQSEIELVQLVGGVYLAVPGSTVDLVLHSVSAPRTALGTFAASVPVVSRRVIGAAGGTVRAPGGLTLSIPTFALEENQTVTVTQTSAVGPAGQLSPVYRFAPEGTVFARPVTVTLPFTGDASHARLFWTKLNSREFENVGGEAVGNTIVAQVTHFSAGVVAPGLTVRTVSGTRIDTFLTDVINRSVPVDLSAPGSVEALVPNGAGGFAVFPGTGTAAGGFTILGVPDGTYYLHTLNSYYVTTNSVLDLGGYRLGRPDLVPANPADDATTKLVFNLGNLLAWQPLNDELEFFSWGANSFIFGVEREALSGAPVAGDTALHLTVDERAFYSGGGFLNLIDAAKGDRAVLIDLTGRVGLVAGKPTGPSYSSVSRIYEAPPFTQVPGTTTVLGNFPATAADNFTDVSQSNPVTITLRTTQFAPLLPALNPAFTASNLNCNRFVPGSPPRMFLDIQAVPANGALQGTLLSQFSSLPDLLILRAPLYGPDMSSGTMFYGTPFRGAVSAFGLVKASCGIPFTIPGATTPVFASAHMSQNASVALLSASPVVPAISAPRSIRINGTADFFAAQTGIGASPTLSWMPPAIGAPQVYTLTVNRLFKDAQNHTRKKPVATLSTQTTSVTLPNLLTIDPRFPSPQYFVFALTAASNANTQFAIAPNRGELPDAAAQTLSGLMAP